MSERRSVARMLPYGGTNSHRSEAATANGLMWRAAQTIVVTRQMAKRVTFSEDAGTTKAASAAAGLYTIFNFYETIQPPPAFATFKEGFSHVAEVVRRHPQFVCGMLLKNVEPRGHFPYLSYTVFRIQPNENFIHDPNWVKVIREGHGDNQIHHQGSFKEVFSLWTDSDDVSIHSSNRLPRDSSDAVYIVVGCKALGDVTQLELSWREWSGADFILEHLLPQQRHLLRRLTLYRRAVHGGSFTHVLLAEFHSHAGEIYRLRDLADRMADRRCGIVGLFGVDMQLLPAAAAN